MLRATKFLFDDYELSNSRSTVTFHYHAEFETGDEVAFQENLTFSESLPNPKNNPSLAQALHFYHIIAGVSYYKAHLAAEIGSHGLDPWAAETMSRVYRRGLGEFIYMNELSPTDIVSFEPEMMQELPTTDRTAQGSVWLVPIGGGKDSLMTTTIIEQSNQEFDTLRINPNSWVGRQLDEIGAPQRLIERKFDDFLISDKKQYRGHVPVTAIVSAAAVIVAVASGHHAVVFSNEASADEPTVDDYQGMAINHQWAKSTEAEELIQTWISRYISADLEYFSLLRAMSELDIAEVFAQAVLPRYSGLWSSSNTNFRHDAPDKLDWDLTSSKTCTVFLLLAPFAERAVLIEEFGGNPFALEANHETWFQLLGQTEVKPFECVATIDEMRQAWALAADSDIWPELQSINPSGV